VPEAGQPRGQHGARGTRAGHRDIGLRHQPMPK
jgi:hypothetical protein